MIDYFAETLPEGVSLIMVKIPGGRFLMGATEGEEGAFPDEYPQRPVTVPPFFLGKYPVTQAQWRAVAKLPHIRRKLNPDPSHFLLLDPSNFKGGDRPVEMVSWHEAVEFCARLKRHTGKDYRLPSEAEWEYACRAGTQTSFNFGEKVTANLANCDNYGRTTPVETFPSNAFGLSDMHGNVCEWCADHWHEDYKGAPADGTAWVSSNKSRDRVIRGGSWLFSPSNCRSAYRDKSQSNGRGNNLGFRLCCSAPAQL